MEKKGIVEVVEKLARGATTQANMLGGEMTQIGRAIGDEDTGAALNTANVALVVGLGAIAGGAAVLAGEADKKSKRFYNKLDTYGGLGVPMDDDCKALTNVGFANWKKADLMQEKGKSLPSYEVIAKHISHNQDKAIQRAFTNDTSIWNLFLFSKQLVKNRVAFGIHGNYPPRIELSLEEFDMSSLDPQTMQKLVDKLKTKGVTLSASGASGRIGQCNLTANFSGFQDALDVLDSGAFKGMSALDGLRKSIRDHITNRSLFGLDIPQFEVPLDALNISGCSTEELNALKEFFAKNGVSLDLTGTPGMAVIAGDADGLKDLLSELINDRAVGSSKAPSFNIDGFSSHVSAHLNTEPMVNFNRELVSLKRELNGFDSIKFKVANGRCVIQTDHGLEDIVQVLMAANRVPESWDKGIKKQMADWAKTNQLDPTYSASFIYGEHQGAAAVQRTLYTRVMDEELSMKAEVAKDELLFFEEGRCTITHLRDAELERVVADRTKDFQQALLEKMPDATKTAQTGVTLSEEQFQKLMEGLSNAR